jgi:hypothetical protein
MAGKVRMMAVANRATLAEIGKTYAEAVRAEPAAKQLWVDHHRDYFELWLVTEPIDADIEYRLYEAELVLHDRFPDAYIRFHVLNPRYFDPFDPADLIPASAEEIPLRHS